MTKSIKAPARNKSTKRATPTKATKAAAKTPAVFTSVELGKERGVAGKTMRQRVRNNIDKLREYMLPHPKGENKLSHAFPNKYRAKVEAIIPPLS